jgi:hypothetical protein
LKNTIIEKNKIIDELDNKHEIYEREHNNSKQNFTEQIHEIKSEFSKTLNEYNSALMEKDRIIEINTNN